MKAQMSHGAGIAGFTLIEALVATALMGLILAMLATITAQWLPNWNHGLVRIQRDDQIAGGLESLTSDLAAAEFIAKGSQDRKPLFDGANRSITFVRTALGPNTGPGLEIVRIAEITSDRGPLLVRTRAPFVPNADRAQPNFSDSVVLVRAPFRVSFSYAGTDRNWREDWRNQIQLPNAVKLTVRDAASRRTLSVSTAVLVRAEIPIDCIAAKSLAECLTSLRPSPEASKSPS